MLYLRQVFKKSISSNTFLYLKSSFSNSLTFLAMTLRHTENLFQDNLQIKWFLLPEYKAEHI